jgi:cytochrome c oxidase subunit I+III
MISTVGAFVFAAGVVIVVFDMMRRFRPTLSGAAGDIWKAGTLEWLNNDAYAARSIPGVNSRYPLWADASLSRSVDAGRWYLPGAATGTYETIVTSPITAKPEYLMRVAGPGWTPLLAAAFTAAFFLILTVHYVTLASICGVVAVAMILLWLWQLDPPSAGRVQIARGVTLPTYVSGPGGHSWWAMVVLMIVCGALYLSYVFSYLYLWTVSPQAWRAAVLPAAGYPACALLLLIASSIAIVWAGRLLSDRTSDWLWSAIIAAASLMLVAAMAVDGYAQWQTGLRPADSGYTAMVSMNLFLQLMLVACLVVMAGFAMARRFTRQLNTQRRVVYENLMLLWHYTVAQSALGLLLTHGFPRVV